MSAEPSYTGDTVLLHEASPRSTFKGLVLLTFSTNDILRPGVLTLVEYLPTPGNAGHTRACTLGNAIATLESVCPSVNFNLILTLAYRGHRAPRWKVRNGAPPGY